MVFLDRARGFERQKLDILEQDIAQIKRVLFQSKSTRIYHKQDHTIRSLQKVISEKGAGHLRELSLESNSASFIVILKVDGESILEHTYSKLNELTDFSPMIDAFQDPDSEKYIINIKNIFWSTEIELKVRPAQTSSTGVTFNNIWASWDIIAAIGLRDVIITRRK